VRELSSAHRDLRTPRVVVSSAGVFHAYHLARGVQAAGYLHRFITSIYSRYETGIDMRKVTQLPLAAGLASAIRTLPGEAPRLASYLLGDSFYDRMASMHIRDADIFHVFNNQGLRSIRMAKARGAVTVVARSSAHARAQERILTGESRFAKGTTKLSRLLVERHIAEYDLADFIFVPSKFVWETMVQEGVSEEKLRRVHLGFDPTRFYPGEKKDDVFRIMYAGGLSLQKGIPYLMEAFAEMNLPNSELLLVGDAYPDARAALREYSGLFRHMRFVPQHELVYYYQQASVFVLPSLQDGFGMVVYEAAGCGLPVIITENVGAEVRHGEDGFVVPIRDANALAEKLRFFHEHPEERKRMGRAACDYVQQFTWQNYHREVIEHYDLILAQRR